MTDIDDIRKSLEFTGAVKDEARLSVFLDYFNPAGLRDFQPSSTISVMWEALEKYRIPLPTDVRFEPVARMFPTYKTYLTYQELRSLLTSSLRYGSTAESMRDYAPVRSYMFDLDDYLRGKHGVVYLIKPNFNWEPLSFKF